MTTTQLLLVLSGLLIAFERQLRAGTWPQWLSAPAWVRALTVIVLGVVSSGLAGYVADGTPFVDGALTGLAAAIPALLTLIMHPQAATVAVLLVVLGGLTQTGCAGSLESARAEGLSARRSAAVGTAPSARCQALDDRRVALSGWAKVALSLAGASGLAVLVPEVQDSKAARVAVVGGIVVSSAAGGGLQIAADQTAFTWTRECSP